MHFTCNMILNEKFKREKFLKCEKAGKYTHFQRKTISTLLYILLNIKSISIEAGLNIYRGKDFRMCTLPCIGAYTNTHKPSVREEVTHFI